MTGAEDVRPYLAMYRGRRITVQARTSLEAQQKAAEEFRAPRRADVDVYLLGAEHAPEILPGA